MAKSTKKDEMSLQNTSNILLVVIIILILGYVFITTKKVPMKNKVPTWQAPTQQTTPTMAPDQIKNSGDLNSAQKELDSVNLNAIDPALQELGNDARSL